MYLIGILVLGLISSVCEAGRILVVIPTPSISHQVVFRPLTQELARRGHEVVVITTDPAFPKGQAPKNLIEIDTHDVSYKMWRDQMFSKQMTQGKSNDLITQIEGMFGSTGVLWKIFEVQMLTDEVQELIKNGTDYFDLIMVEACVRSSIAVSHVFKAPVIIVSSFSAFYRNYDIVGAPMRPSLLYPTLFRQRIFDMSLWDKLIEFYQHHLFEHKFDAAEDVENKMIKRLFGPDTPSITELENNVDMLFLNVHHIWELNRPVPPGVIYTGGMDKKIPKDLPQELKSYLDSSKHGVIYLSFGTNVNPSSLPPEKIQKLVNVFSKLPYDVLWKWDKDELPGRSPNIRISKWLPQFDLLRHPKVKMFITQGGLQSTDEAIIAGVPLIGMPMLGDQWHNVEMYRHFQIGVKVDMETLTEETFLNGINTIANDERYRKNIIRLGGVMRDEPQSALERAVWWTEHVLRHGGAEHLRARAAHMTWSEYLDTELIAALAAIALAVLGTGATLAYLLIRFVSRTVLTGAKLKRS